ncbi:MAG: AAA family ATPase, partial [Sedimenticolaceae bacterium]
MYESFYQLRDDPFRLLPDPRVCFAHSSCAKAWAYLHYALKRGEGIVVVTGPSGSGKTTLAERLLTGLNPSKVVSVRLIANDLNPTDLLRKLGYSLGLPVEGLDRAMLSHRIERYLIELEHSQRRALVLIDEAQTLSHQSLESMRLMTDMQSRSRPVFQLILLGQEGLEDVMSAPGMEQFQQRVIASCRLQTMTLEETKAYIEYRLEAADWTGDPSVNGPAIKAIYDYSHGLPRHVNKICSRLLLHGSTEEKHALNERDVTAVVRDLRDELLAPLHDDADRASEGSQGIFDPVHGLALTPSPRAQVVQVPSALPPTPEPCLADAPPVDEAPMQPVADSQSLTRPSWSGRAASFASWRRVPASTTGERGNYQRYSAALWRWPRPVMAGLGIAAAGAVAILSWQFNGPTATASKPRLELGTTSVEGRGYVLNDDQGRLGLPYGSVLDLGIRAQDAPADASDGWQTALDFGQAAAGVAQDEIWDSVADTRRPGSGLDSVARRPANLED